MAAGAFTAADGEPDQPEHGEDDGDNPEQVHREARAEEHEYEQ